MKILLNVHFHTNNIVRLFLVCVSIGPIKGCLSRLIYLSVVRRKIIKFLHTKYFIKGKVFLVFIRNQFISGGIKTSSHPYEITMSCIVLYPVSTNIKMYNYNIKTSFLARADFALLQAGALGPSQNILVAFVFEVFSNHRKV